MSNTAVYIRVSSKRQDTASQEPDVKRYLAANGLEGATVYRDKFTGRTMERPGFSKLLAAIRAGEVKNVIVWRLDRLGRTASGLAALFAELNARKVNLVSLRDGLDLSTPAGRLMGHVLASVAEYETEVRAERVLSGPAPFPSPHDRAPEARKRPRLDGLRKAERLPPPQCFGDGETRLRERRQRDEDGFSQARPLGRRHDVDHGSLAQLAREA